jgi:hypothetical protein
MRALRIEARRRERAEGEEQRHASTPPRRTEDQS